MTYSVADAADAPPPPPLQREWPSAAARSLLETPSATLAALEPPPAAAAAAVIVVVAGLPGSGAADAADALAAATRDRARWLTTASTSASGSATMARATPLRWVSRCGRRSTAVARPPTGCRRACW